MATDVTFASVERQVRWHPVGESHSRPRWARLDGVQHRFFGAVALSLVVACGSGNKPADDSGVACPDALTVGQGCSAPVKGSRTLSISLAAHQYLQLSATSTGSPAIALSGGYAGEALRTKAEGPDLAFYNPGDAPLTAQVDLQGNGSVAVKLQASAFEPATSCVTDCGALLQLPLPREADAFRTISPPRYQFGRRELVQAVIGIATQLRQAIPGLNPVGIADFSQKDGQVPGTDINGPRHTYPAHAGGYAVDVAYYRANGDNSGKPACPITDGMFCTGPHDIDVARNVQFLRRVTTNLHAIQLIVDPVMEADVRAELTRQSDADPMAVSRAARMLQSGPLFQYHADHFHIAFAREPTAVSSLKAHHQAAETSVAIGPNGEVMVAFMLLDDQNAIGYAYSPNFGIDWQPTQLLRAPDGRLSNDPSVAVDAAGNFYVTWLALRLPPSDAHIYWARAPVGTGSFGAAAEVSVPTEDFAYDRPNIKLSPQGTPLITYARGPVGGSLDTIVVAAAPDGTHFSRTAVAGPTPTAFRNFPYLCVPPGGNRVYLAYGDSGSVWLQSSADGQQWDAAGRFQVYTQTTSDPRCVADGNDVWILDAKAKAFPPAGAPTLQSLLLRHSGDGGQSLDPIITVADDTGGSLFMLGNLSVGGTGLVNITYYEGTVDGDTTARFRVLRARDRSAAGFWPALTLYSPVILRTGYGARWLGDYTGNVEAFGILNFAFADNSGDGSQLMFSRAILP
jgi:hypothetical protein